MAQGYSESGGLSCLGPRGTRSALHFGAAAGEPSSGRLNGGPGPYR